ncbi:hypothetical protein EDC04DRAFT_2612808 [Pisolithus marmoratus]|nr:hypothetical protein EDC04DRAFT_2612808 [Pisolithus marmoratus]
MSDKSAPATQQLPPPLPSLLSVIESQPTTSANQAGQLPSTSTSATPAKGLLHNSYLDSLNLAVNAEFDFLACQICQTALGVDDVKQHLTIASGMEASPKMEASFGSIYVQIGVWGLEASPKWKHLCANHQHFVPESILLVAMEVSTQPLEASLEASTQPSTIC